ncbi:TRIM2_3 [Mytilus coruscus]|uniref:TRIM2_3 n=1 Tax=Mytilus coruscus TaxID=42192 RepID=A0A6J8ALE2_MYTCO|nr:TRIM2_3 [Mytilus coruscus]
MKENDEIENTLKKLGSLESLEVMVFKTDIALNRETSVRREAQVQSQEQSNINNMTMNIETEIDMNIEEFVISDMICLIDGRVIVVERWGITQINQNTIAVTDPEEEAIKIFNMENETVTKVITLDTQCCGLSFSNNSLAVGLGADEIRIIDLEGNMLKVIYSDNGGKAVYCVDESGKQIWQYKQDLSGPRGLCRDNYGNIIVADYNANRVIVISKDGQNSKILMSKKDPWCICFKHNESSGFICLYYESNLTKFN